MSVVVLEVDEFVFEVFMLFSIFTVELELPSDAIFNLLNINSPFSKNMIVIADRNLN